MARKPAPSSSGANGLMSLTIDGPVNGTTECSIKQNRTILLGRGSENYILTLREGIFEGSTVPWRVPEMWDRNWNFKLGPIATPLRVDNITTSLWLKPEAFEKRTDGSDFVEKWVDSSAVPHTVENSEDDDQPIFNPGNSTYNNFNSITAAGDDNLTYPIGGSDTTFDVDVSANNFACVMFLKTHVDSTADQWLINLGRQGEANTWTLRTSSGLGLIIAQAAVITTYIPSIAVNTSYIIAVGSDTGGGGDSAFARINGTDITPLSGGTTVDILPDQIMIMNQDNALTATPFLGEMYEIIWFKQSGVDTTIFTTAIEKIEGYLAHKYLVTGALPAAHPYKTNPPRVSPVGV